MDAIKGPSLILLYIRRYQNGYKQSTIYVQQFQSTYALRRGFDRVFDQLQNYVEHNATSTGFPPYNIRKGGDYTYAIEMALAGFSKDDIEVEVEDGLLTVRSIKENDENDSNMYRGISYRKFNRKFTLADDIVVNDASLENGMLKIDLERIVPDEKKSRKITIK